MEYTHLGRSGLSVSRLCLGTMNFGWKTEEADSHAIMDRAPRRGRSTSSTPPTSTASTPARAAPRRCSARWFAQGGERREKTVLATKVYGGMSDWPNDTFLSARNIVRACEASLRRMQTDWIDLYQFHHVDLRTPWEEIWQACETLVAQGKVLYVGSSNHAGLADRRGQRGGRPPATSRAWSASSRTTTCSPGTSSSRCCPPRSTTASASSRGARWPAACSAGVLEKTEGGRRSDERTQKRVEKHRPALEQYEAFCREIGARARPTSGWPGCCTSRR